MEIKPCPVCGNTKIMVIEHGEAERDTLTQEMWFVSDVSYSCRCMNDDCIHDSPEAQTYEKAVELWNLGIVRKWEEHWYRRYHNDEIPVSDFY